MSTLFHMWSPSSNNFNNKKLYMESPLENINWDIRQNKEDFGLVRSPYCTLIRASILSYAQSIGYRSLISISHIDIKTIMHKLIYVCH